MTLKGIVAKVIKGEKAIGAVTTVIKFVAALVACAVTIIGGIRAVNEIKRARWERERKEWMREQSDLYQFRLDSAFKVEIIRRLTSIELIQSQQVLDGVKVSSSLQALDKSHQTLLTKLGEVTLLTDYLRSQIKGQQKQDSIANQSKDVMFNFSIQPVNGKKN